MSSKWKHVVHVVLFKGFEKGVKLEQATVENKNESSIYEEYRFLRNLVEDLGLQLARENQRLYEIIGQIQNVFPKTTKLDEIIEVIIPYRFDFADRELPDDLNSHEQFEAWEKAKIGELANLIEDEYNKPIQDLLAYLKEYIDTVEQNLDVLPCEFRCCLCKMP